MKTVLVVEDNSTTLAGLLVLIGAKGYAVQGSSSAEQADVIIKERMPDIVFTDYFLNCSDGIALGEQIRAMPNGDYPKMVLMTASDGSRLDAYRDKLHELQMEVLIKPFETDNLYELLLRLSREQDEKAAGT